MLRHQERRVSGVYNRLNDLISAPLCSTRESHLFFSQVDICSYGPLVPSITRREVSHERCIHCFREIVEAFQKQPMTILEFGPFGRKSDG
jgi:hypothetical protein